MNSGSVFPLIAVFILGFSLGKKYILKGLTLRYKQLVESGDYDAAAFIKKVMEGKI